MNYIIATEKSEPAYIQLYMLLRDDIVKGIYPRGTKLPSKRLLADECGISVITVEHAYALLCDEGYVEARERSGYFVIFSVGDRYAASAFEVRHRNLADVPKSGSAPDFPFSVLTKTMRGVISDWGEAILERSPNAGSDVLREEIAKYLARSRGITADAEQIVIGSGSEYLYTLILVLLGGDYVYAIESPSYKKIEQVYSAARVKFEKLPLGKDGIKSSSLEKSKADILHVSPFRSYPSGVTASASKRHEYIRFANADEKFIIEDDFESEFTVSKKPEETLFSLASRDNVIYMNTFSKTISPSLRVGYMVLPKKLLGKFSEKLGFFSCTVPTYIQYVLAELISSGDFERHINRVRRHKRRG